MKILNVKPILILYIEIVSKSLIITISNGFIYPLEEVKVSTSEAGTGEHASLGAAQLTAYFLLYMASRTQSL